MINDMEDDIALITKRVQKLMMKDKFSGRTCNRKVTTRNKVLQEKNKKRENELEK